MTTFQIATIAILLLVLACAVVTAVAAVKILGLRKPALKFFKTGTKAQEVPVKFLEQGSNFFGEITAIAAAAVRSNVMWEQSEAARATRVPNPGPVPAAGAPPVVSVKAPEVELREMGAAPLRIEGGVSMSATNELSGLRSNGAAPRDITLGAPSGNDGTGGG